LVQNKATIEISKDLYEKIKKRLELDETDFKTVDAFVESVLDQIIRDKEIKDEEDKKKIVEQLRRLGYF